MSIYGESGPMREHRTQVPFKGKSEHIAKVNLPNLACLNKHIDMEIPHGSRDHVIIPDTVKIRLNIESESADKTRSIVNNVRKALWKEEVVMF